MIGVTPEEMAAARSLIAKGSPKALGYRLLVQQVYEEDSMEASLKGEFKALAKMGFETKSKEEKERHDKGTPYVILLHKGAGAFTTEATKGFDCDVGSVLVVDRYSGVEFEFPPASGNKFRFMNDEAVLGLLESKDG